MRSASPPPTLTTLWRRDGSIRQSPAAPHPRPPPLATLGRRESLATFCGERFGGHSRQRRRCPLNGAPSKRAPSRRWAAFLAKYRPDASPKEPRTVKTPLRGKISPPCIQNELVLARYARYVFKMPRKAPLGNTPREYFAIKCPFSRPNPLNHAWRTNLAAQPHPGGAVSVGRIPPCPAASAGRILPHGGSRRENLTTTGKRKTRSTGAATAAKALNPNHRENTRSPSAFSHRHSGDWQPRFRWCRIQRLSLHQAPGAYRQVPTQELCRG